MKKFTIKEISTYGIVPLFSSTENGRITISLSPDELSRIQFIKASMNDICNHILSKVFVFDQLICHRTRVDRNHYRKAACKLEWMSDGNAEFSFHLGKLMCLEGKDSITELTAVKKFLTSIAIVMTENESRQIAVEFSDNSIRIVDLNDANFMHSDISGIENACGFDTRLSKLVKDIQESHDKANACSVLRITEETLFHPFQRPHNNFLLAAKF